MAFITKVKLPNEVNARDLRDAASMHYLGHTTTEIVPTGETSPTGATITIGGVSVTAVANDYVTAGSANLNYIFNGTSWDALSEAVAEADVQDVTVAGVSVLDTSDHTAKIVVATASDDADPAFGVVKTGANITNTSGVISVEDAAVGTKGVVELVGSIGDSSTAATDKAPTEKAVADAIEALPSPMVFRGTVGAQADNPTITALPVDGTAKVGDTYKVITDGTYAGESAEVGDVFICRTKTSSANTWVLIPSGDEPDGTVTNIAGADGIITNNGTADGQPITESGTIKLALKSPTALSNAAEAVDTTTDHIYPLVLDDDGYLATPIDIDSAEIPVSQVTDVTANNSVVTGVAPSATAETSSVVLFAMDTTDTEQLNLLYLNPTSADTAVFYEAPTP